jgi:hypothetical protein
MRQCDNAILYLPQCHSLTHTMSLFTSLNVILYLSQGNSLLLAMSFLTSYKAFFTTRNVILHLPKSHSLPVTVSFFTPQSHFLPFAISCFILTISTINSSSPTMSFFLISHYYIILYLHNVIPSLQQCYSLPSRM